MFRFQDPQYLPLLSLIIILALLYVFNAYKVRHLEKQLADKRLLSETAPKRSPKRRLLKFVLLETALAFLILMMARPQFGTSNIQESERGIEVSFIVDVSNSMMAQDILPNRLERSKLFMSTLIDRMKNDRVSLGVFAGEAYPQMPITNDYTSAKLFLENFEPGMVTLQGTSIASAINLAKNSFSARKDIGKAIVIITDGEDHEEGAIKAAEEARKEGCTVFIIGVGTVTGSKIPLPSGGVLKDNDGQEVVTKLNETMCREIAEAGGGTYIHLDNSNQAQQILRKQFDELKQADNSFQFTEKTEQFQAMALIALLLIILEFFISSGKAKWLKRFRT